MSRVETKTERMRNEDYRKQQLRKEIDVKKQRQFETAMAVKKQEDTKQSLSTAAAKQAIKEAQGKAKPEQSDKTGRTQKEESLRKGTEQKVVARENKKRAKITEEQKEEVREEKRTEAVIEQAVRRKRDTEQGENGFDSSGQPTDEFFRQAFSLATQKTPETSPSDQAHAARSLPPAVINEIVDRIYLGTQKGISEMVIDLKANVLGGGRINVSSSNGKIRLAFIGLDDEAKRLVRNSKDEISKRLEDKSLALEQFEVD